MAKYVTINTALVPEATTALGKSELERIKYWRAEQPAIVARLKGELRAKAAELRNAINTQAAIQPEVLEIEGHLALAENPFPPFNVNATAFHKVAVSTEDFLEGLKVRVSRIGA